jgi:hypothetical protein
VLSDYLHLLKEWKIKYAPESELAEWHPLFCEALENITRVEDMLDTLLSGDVVDRAFAFLGKNCPESKTLREDAYLAETSPVATQHRSDAQESQAILEITDYGRRIPEIEKRLRDFNA